ncbi:MAG TPA: ATP-binding protein, partial [Polyangiaceae bacterium]|nr:ATP-binding protein [Polyangiaceae bacterium]
AVPSIADWCAVDMLEEGKLERLAVAHVDPTKVEWVRQARQRHPSNPESPQSVHGILKSGEAQMVAEITPELFESATQNEEHLRVLRELDLRSYIAVPLAHEGTTFGVITLAMAESGRRYTKDDFELAKSLADRAALAVTNARLYQRAASAHDQAVMASRAKDEFLAMLGHELRNPLAPIQTALDLMRLKNRGQVPAENQVIERQVKHLVRLVDDLLDVSRIAHNRVDLVRKRVDLKDVVERALEIAWPPSSSRAHTVHVELGNDLIVLGDAIRLAQVVANLLSNSIKYTPAGGNIWLQTRREGDSAWLSVRDDGQGIGQETLTRVFDMFVQEPQALDRARGGLGLGLAIVRSLVIAHGGTVSAHSDGPGRGTEFVIELPLSLNTAKSVPPGPPPNPVRASERVLVVDDNHDARELLARLLGHLGHSTWTADNGFDALAIAAAHHPTLALLDIGLPGMDGYEVARRLKALRGLDNLRMVAVTGYGQAVDRARSWDAGFVAHIVKPLSLEKLTDLVGTSADDSPQTLG